MTSVAETTVAGTSVAEPAPDLASGKESTAALRVALLGCGTVEILASQDDTARHKPHPDPLLLAADRLGVEPTDCVYVGDAVVDLQAGQAAGMSTIGVTWGAGLRSELVGAGPTEVVDDIAGLRQTLLAS